jgi:hypothetical protein
VEHAALGPGFAWLVRIGVPLAAILIPLGFFLSVAASITSTGGKGSPREGRDELKRHCAVNASSQFLVGCTGLPVPFACSETNELREELVGSDLYQVHLHHEFEFNYYDRSCQTTMYV